jgi:renalase
MASVAIVGAGLAGVAAALELRDAGFRVTVFERSRHIGERCASKPEPETFDHGAQYFTVTDPNFARVVKALERGGGVAPWNGRIVEFREGQYIPKCDTRRYVGVPAMRSMIESLASPLDVQTVHGSPLRASARGAGN